LYDEAIINQKYQNDGKIIQREALNFAKQQECRKLFEYGMSTIKTGEFKNKNTFNNIMEKMSKIPDIGNEEERAIDVFDNIENVLRDDYRESILTNINFIDGVNSGLGRGEVGLVLASLGSGKTSFLTKIANSGANQGKNVIQIIFEDNKTDIQRKHYAIWSGIPLSEFKIKRQEIIKTIEEI